MNKREFLVTMGTVAGLAAGGARAQAPTGADSLGRTATPKPKAPTPRRQARTTKLFLTPPCWPNAIAVEEGRGFWVQEQRHDRQPEKAWLLDFTTGKVLHEVSTHCEDTSGMTVGNGCIWSGANGAAVKNPPNPPVNGIFQTDMASRQISVRQIPFGPANDGGSCHGMAWENGKLWLYANRLQALMRIDPRSWAVDWMFPVARDVDRLHGIEWHDGAIWQVCGRQDPHVPGPDGYTPGLVKYDAHTGKVLEFVDFVPGSCDIHDLAVWNGRLFGVDAGEHPGWPIDARYARPGFPELNTASGGWVFAIDVI